MITGASRGIGREFARQYAAAGWRVLATCRDPAKYDGAGEVHPLDVTHAGSVAALSEKLSGEVIDMLINNAGIYGPRISEPGAIEFDAWENVLRTNLLGPVRVARAFSGHVARSPEKKMVFISSKKGSIAENDSGGDYIYRSSKAALNMAVKSLSIDLWDRGVLCILLHPGWVRTAMGGSAASLDVETSVSGMRETIERAYSADSGGFFNYDGRKLPW
jgi:NAD(P)-dependent dehydrogenase (short-subunit alcohol dehydrogenase family)